MTENLFHGETHKETVLLSRDCDRLWLDIDSMPFVENDASAKDDEWK
jgi:hypothetical protein